MDRETNIDSILALDAEIIRLKRTQNSLLNIARVPPEILGHIFHLNVIPEATDNYLFELQEGSHNFLLVCHHWFRVARNTTELWTFWGDKLEDWKRRYPLSGASAPVDLVLDGVQHEVGPFDETLRDVLRDRAARDVIRRVHIKCPSEDHITAAAIISSLTPADEGIQHSSIESIALDGMDVSNFFSHHHFPKLRNLSLSDDFKMSCWDHLKSYTTALAYLALSFNDTAPPSIIPTASQVLSLLASNPNIEDLVLLWLMISDDSRNSSTSLVPLCHLEHFVFVGYFHHVFPILRRLELPEGLGNAELGFHKCTLKEAYETIRPYIRDYLQRDPRFKYRLGVSTSISTGSFLLRACVINAGHHGLQGMSPRGPPYVTFQVRLLETSRKDLEKLCTDTLALLPRESVVALEVDLMEIEEVVVTMPNLESLSLVGTWVYDGILLPNPDGPNAQKKLFPSLQRLYLKSVSAVGGNWDPLIAYLAHQTSDGQTVSLNMFGNGVHVCSEVVKQIEDLVEEFVYIPDPNQGCPFDSCLGGGAVV